MNARVSAAALVSLAVLTRALPGQEPAALVPGAGLPRAAPHTVGLHPDSLRHIAIHARATVDSGRIAGALVAVARHGQVAWLETFGTARVGSGESIAPDAVFRIYSMTKPVTAVAVLQLVEQGRLHLDDDVARYIPAFAGVRVYESGASAAPATRAAARGITIRDLLAHTSGMSYGFGTTPVDSIVSAFDVFRATRTAHAFADSIALLPLVGDPGGPWRYGPGLEVAAGVVEAVTGVAFDEYVAAHILQPLRMLDTSFRLTPATRSRLVALHENADGTLRVPEEEPITGIYEPDARFACGGCGLLSTAGDFLRFAQMLLNGGELDGARVLRRETVELMTRDVLQPGASVSRSMGAGYGHGLGVAVQTGPPTHEHPTAPGTFGWIGGASTAFWIDPANDLIVLVMAQHVPYAIGPFTAAVKQRVYAALAEPAR